MEETKEDILLNFLKWFTEEYGLHDICDIGLPGMEIEEIVANYLCKNKDKFSAVANLCLAKTRGTEGNE